MVLSEFGVRRLRRAAGFALAATLLVGCTGRTPAPIPEDPTAAAGRLVAASGGTVVPQLLEGYAPPVTHAWLIGYFDDLAVAIWVRDGASGSATAGPVLRAFLSA